MTMHSKINDAVDEMIEEHGENISYLEDSIFEQVDGLVPVYNWGIINEWDQIDIYDAEDYSGEPNIIGQMRAALFEWYDREIRGELGRRGLYS